jgi:putative redox protein
MKVHVRRVDDAFRMVGSNEAGNTLTMDTSPEHGGSGEGVGPMQMVAMALAGCSAIDIIEILRKARQNLEGFEAEVDAQRAEGQTPAVFTRLHVTYHLTGDLDPGKVQRAIELSIDKYCSVAHMLRKTATISYAFSINGTHHVIKT